MNIENRGGIWATLGLYLAWLITALGVIADALYIREAIVAILTAINAVHSTNFTKAGGIGVDLNFAYSMTFADELILTILFIAAIAFVIAIEYYFRKGRPKGLLLRRIITVVVIEVGIIVVSILISLFV